MFAHMHVHACYAGKLCMHVMRAYMHEYYFITLQFIERF